MPSTTNRRPQTPPGLTGSGAPLTGLGLVTAQAPAPPQPRFLLSKQPISPAHTIDRYVYDAVLDEEGAALFYTSRETGETFWDEPPSTSMSASDAISASQALARSETALAARAASTARAAVSTSSRRMQGKAGVAQPADVRALAMEASVPLSGDSVAASLLSTRTAELAAQVCIYTEF